MLFDVGQGAMRTANHLTTVSAAYGINAQRLQDMERAGIAANVSVDKMDASLIGLQQNLAALNLGQISSGFLEAAGRFGLSIRPGQTEKDIMEQLGKRVPQFVKAHGAMGAAMASTLLSQMGIAPEMIQLLTTGARGKQGQNLTQQNIAALTDASNKIGVLSFDIKNLGAQSISPLIDVLGEISGYLQPIATAMGGVSQLASPIEAAKAWGSRISGALQEAFKYVTPEEARTAAEHNKTLNYAKKYGVMGQSPLISASLPHAPMSVAQILAANRPSVSSHMENHFYGVEDDKIADSVKRAGRDLHDKMKLNYAITTAMSNPPAQ